MADETDCNKYYLCNQGEMMEQRCPDGLHWVNSRCDWPANSGCTIPTTTPHYEEEITGVDEEAPQEVDQKPAVTVKPVYDGTGYKVRLPQHEAASHMSCTVAKLSSFNNQSWTFVGRG